MAIARTLAFDFFLGFSIRHILQLKSLTDDKKRDAQSYKYMNILYIQAEAGSTWKQPAAAVLVR